MRWLHFILSHSIFVSACAVALCFQTFSILHITPNNYAYGFIFCATLSSYNFYWLISKYYFNKRLSIPAFLRKNFSNILLFSLAGVGVLVFLYFLPGILMNAFIACGLTLIYSIPLWPFKKPLHFPKIGFLKTVLLAFTWAYVTVIIPVQQSIFISNLPVGLLFSARFCFMLMLCTIFDSRDIHVDKIHALKSLATDVNKRTLQIIMAIVFTLYITAGLFLRYYFDTNVQIIAFLIVGLVTLCAYKLSLKKQGYFFYYFAVDGLMLFSAVGTWVANYF